MGRRVIRRRPRRLRLYFDPAQPRDGHGRWTRTGRLLKKLEHGLAHGEHTVGLTPFRDESKGDVRGPGFYRQARTRAFRRDLVEVGRRHGVTVLSDRPADGVWAGGGEPSFAIRVKDGEAGVDAWAGELVRKYGQWAGVRFTGDVPRAHGFLATIGGYTPGRRAELDAALEEHGVEGATIRRDGSIEIMGKGSADLAAAAQVARALGLRADIRRGRFRKIANPEMKG